MKAHELLDHLNCNAVTILANGEIKATWWRKFGHHGRTLEQYVSLIQNRLPKIIILNQNQKVERINHRGKKLDQIHFTITFRFPINKKG